jgi:hypothetical protein
MGCKASAPVKKDIKAKMNDLKNQVEEKAVEIISQTLNQRIPVNTSIDIRAIRDQMKNQLIEKDAQLEIIKKDNEEQKKKIIELENSTVKKIMPKQLPENAIMGEMDELKI